MSNRFLPGLLGLLLGLVALAPSTALAIGEQNGRLEGRVVEQGTEAPVPGANVSITSPSLPGGARTATTNEDGFYSFDQLPPGAYTVEISYSGLKPLYRKVTVAQGTLTPLNVSWSAEIAETETTVVVQQRTLTRPDSTTQGTVTTNDEQSKIATGRSYQSVAQQVAGVSGGSNPDVRGASELKNRYLIDGLDVTDPVTNTFSANLNFDSLSSFEILTGGMEAQYNSLGGVINVVTATGGDEFHLDTSVYANHYRLSAPAQFGSSPIEGFRPFDDTVRPPTQRVDANLNVSGPILKQKLWFNTSFQYIDSQSSQPAAAPFNVQAPNSVFRSFLLRGKLTYAPTAKHRITLSASADPTSIAFADFAGAAANSTSLTAARHQNQGGAIGTVIWDYFLSERTSLQMQAGTGYQILDIGPEGLLGEIPPGYQEGFSEAARVYDYNRPRHVNLNDNTAWYNTTSNVQDRRNRAQLDTSVSHRFEAAGRHDARAGIQLLGTQHRYYLERPGGGLIYSDRDRGGATGEEGLCLDETTGVGCFQRTINPSYQQRNYGGSIGLYVQDRWKPTTWLTILPGLRFDYGTSRDNADRVVSRLWGFGPRLGATVDLTRDQKTIFSAYYGRANEVLSLLAAANASEAPASRVENWNPNSNSWVDGGTIGGPGSIRLDPNAKAPHSDSIELGLRREIVPGAAASFLYTYKRISNIWDLVEQNTIWDPTGTRVLGFVDPNDPRQIYKLTTPNGNYNVYNGFDFIVEARPSASWYMYGAYTLAFKTGPGSEELGQIGLPSRYYNIRQRDLYTGYAFGDIRHQIKFNGAYTLKNFTIGPNMSFETGTVQAKTSQILDPYGTVGSILHSPIGTQSAQPDNGQNPNNIRTVTEFRTPNFFSLSLRAQYNFQELTRQNISLIADVFNVLNLSQGLGYNSNVTPSGTFGLVSSRQAPLRVQLGVRYVY